MTARGGGLATGGDPHPGAASHCLRTDDRHAANRAWDTVPCDNGPRNRNVLP